MAKYIIRKEKKLPEQEFIMLKELFQEYRLKRRSNSINLFENDKILLNLVDDILYAYPDKQVIRIGIREGVHKVTQKCSIFYRRQLSKRIDIFCSQYGIDEAKAISVISGIFYAAGGYVISAKRNHLQISRLLSFWCIGIITFCILSSIKVLHGLNSPVFQYTYIVFAAALFIKDLIYMFSNKDIQSCFMIVTGRDSKGHPLRIYTQSIILCACLIIIMIERIFWGT